jgi:hypothetical protein
MGLQTNTKKTEVLVFLPGRIQTFLTADAHEARMDDLYQEEQRGRKVSCQEYRADMTWGGGSLWSPLETQPDIYTLFALRATDASTPAAPRRLTAVNWEGKYRCPMTGFSQGEEGRGCSTPFNLRWHFEYRHIHDEVVIGGQFLPCCQLCGM